MYPHERSLVKQLSNKKFALIGVNSDKDREKLKEVLEEKNISWRSFWNGGSTSGPISTRWNVRGWPTIYVLDANGVIRFKNVRGAQMDRAIETLLEELGEPVSITHEEEEEGEGEESGGEGKPDAKEDKGGDKPAEPKSDDKGNSDPE
jgi:hypothetical protein